ncbi:MAG: Lactoylglutathione lyase [Geoglossum simile]|nr:MAG: Lactoylglutathione lyase [Geoglossum simile]
MAATDVSKYKLLSTMLRVKDPEASLKFYSFLGLTLLKKVDFSAQKFSIYLLAYDSPDAISHGAHFTDREGVIELTHNHGTENDPNYRPNNGNTEPHRGFGHICISVDNIQAACKRIADAGYAFQKRLEDGRMKNVAFALDPDGYWVEIVGQKKLEDTAKNHSMFRVKDIQKSLSFYQNTIGLTLLKTHEFPAAKFNLYFLGYNYNKVTPETSPSDVIPVAHFEGLLELTYNYGTENDPGFAYHDGNSEPKGCGGICISVDDLDAACDRFDGLEVRWRKKLSDGDFKDIAFVLDPDGYSLEVVQNERIKKRTGW